MSMNAQAYNQYKNATVETVAPEKLLLMLYDGAIRFIENAQQAIEEKKIGIAHQQIVKAELIILELMATLKMDYKVSQGLFSLYDYLHHQLVQANVKKDVAILQEVNGFITELRDTWAEAVKISKTAVASSVETEVKPNLAQQANSKVANSAVPTRPSLNLQG